MDIDVDILGIPDTDYDIMSVTMPSGESVRIELSKKGIRFVSDAEEGEEGRRGRGRSRLGLGLAHVQLEGPRQVLESKSSALSKEVQLPLLVSRVLPFPLAVTCAFAVVVRVRPGLRPLLPDAEDMRRLGCGRENCANVSDLKQQLLALRDCPLPPSVFPAPVLYARRSWTSRPDTRGPWAPSASFSRLRTCRTAARTCSRRSRCAQHDPAASSVALSCVPVWGRARAVCAGLD